VLAVAKEVCLGALLNSLALLFSYLAPCAGRPPTVGRRIYTESGMPEFDRPGPIR